MSTIREIPHTLPSLELMVLRVTVPMTVEDFDAIIDAIGSWRTAMTKPPAPPAVDTKEPTPITPPAAGKE